MATPSREDAWQLLQEYTKSPALINHSLSVEAAMKYFANHFGEDEETWGIVGLLHDFDYEKYSDNQQHPQAGQAILEEKGYSDEIRRAIMAHAPHTGTSRDSILEKTIFAVDELCGFIYAVTLVRPSKKIAEVEVKSVKKKLKQKKFAENVSREDIALGVQELSFSLDEHIGHVLKAMQGAAERIGL